MSTRIVSECWPLAMSPIQKAVLISLADQTGVCWPSIGTMVLRTCLTDRAVRKAARELESMGNWLATAARAGPLITEVRYRSGD
ncbi:helix-turn-helix domain-containing protein [Microbulbifer sp.]|uniref:helix-turn-helix domain-containing protein n=1 Tax=Microbulbifer sp. TaxID=1908541 RepID=UPI00338E53E4